MIEEPIDTSSMRVPLLDLIAREWIELARGAGAGLANCDYDANELFELLIRHDPANAWELVKRVLAASDVKPEHPEVQLLAAGPVEELLLLHGEMLIDRIESDSKVIPEVGVLLGGVWKSGIPNHIWKRIESAREYVW
jgi:hypothetical protein